MISNNKIFYVCEEVCTGKRLVWYVNNQLSTSTTYLLTHPLPNYGSNIICTSQNFLKNLRLSTHW